MQMAFRTSTARPPRDPEYIEAQMWRLLRERRLSALKFRRRVHLGAHAAAFVSQSAKLIVECGLRAPSDLDRDAWLSGQGFQVLRFEPSEVTGAPARVLTDILAAARTRGWATAFGRSAAS